MTRNPRAIIFLKSLLLLPKFAHIIDKYDRFARRPDVLWIGDLFASSLRHAGSLGMLDCPSLAMG
jgi:hypothetical protein